MEKSRRPGPAAAREATGSATANPEQIGRHLRHHPQLAPEMRRAPGLRLPGAWEGFEVAVRVLMARDVGHGSTAAVMGKLAATYGQPLAAAQTMA